MALTKTKTLLLLSSIALLSTPASAHTAKKALQLSNNDNEFTDLSAKRRQAKARYAKAKHVKARAAQPHHAKVAAKARVAKAPAVPDQAFLSHGVQTSSTSIDAQFAMSIGAEGHKTKRRERQARPQPTRYAANQDPYALMMDRHSVNSTYHAPLHEAPNYQAAPSQTPAPTRAAMRARRPTGSTGVEVAGGFGLVEEARRYIGTNPTKYSSLWCADFMNMVLERTGYRGTQSRMAKSFASYGTRVWGPQVGAIAVMSRGKNGGHVGIVSGVDSNGNPIIISGNHNKRVAEAVYPRQRIYAYVMP